jgi:transposase
VFKPQSLSPRELFVACSELVRPATTPFYAKLDRTLQSFDFATQARSLCAPAYSATGRGRPGIDPVVYFKMLMVGFFEDLASERGIAERCNDSISIRAFLGYDLTGTTPDHSTLSIIRQRLGEEIYDQVFLLILSALDKHGLLKGKNVGIDASVSEANAALKSLINRNTEEAYWEYVQRLAKEMSAAKRKWWESGGLKFRFLPVRFLPALRTEAFLPSSGWHFFPVFFFVFFPVWFCGVSAHDELLAAPPQMPLLQSLVCSGSAYRGSAAVLFRTRLSPSQQGRQPAPLAG